jgi:hypothetical protein
MKARKGVLPRNRGPCDGECGSQRGSGWSVGHPEGLPQPRTAGVPRGGRNDGVQRVVGVDGGLALGQVVGVEGGLAAEGADVVRVAGEGGEDRVDVVFVGVSVSATIRSGSPLLPGRGPRRVRGLLSAPTSQHGEVGLQRAAPKPC